MILLDTHALLWALGDDPRLGPAVRAWFDDDTVPMVVSTASVWEMAIKASIGKLTLGRPLPDVVRRVLPSLGIPTVGIEDRHVLAVEALPWHHRDPFDRVLAATALVEGWTLASADPIFDAYGVRRAW